MAKLAYNELTTKKTFTMDGDPYLVLSNNISKKDRQKASNVVRMKNLRSGNVIEKTFHQSDVLEEADLEKKTIKYLYTNRGDSWFCVPTNPRERFTLSADTVGDLPKYVKENAEVQAQLFENEIMSVITPIKVELQVTEAPEAVKGNTSSGATKEVEVETGLRLQAPQFINTGDVIAINTELGLYSERILKA